PPRPAARQRTPSPARRPAIVITSHTRPLSAVAPSNASERSTGLGNVSRVHATGPVPRVLSSNTESLLTTLRAHSGSLLASSSGFRTIIHRAPPLPGSQRQ